MGNSVMESLHPVGAKVSKFYSSSSWIDGRAEDQLQQVAGWQDMLHVAAFPDLHVGKFGPVGAAFLAGRIYPQLIGPDIGCGMALFALDLPLRKLRLDKAARRLRVLEGGIEDAAQHLRAAGLPIDLVETLGTIGGGNHFCELLSVVGAPGADAGLRENDLVLLVHSGSRALGASVFTALEKGAHHGFAPDSDQAADYLNHHNQAVQWARLNRSLIASRAAQALGSHARLLCDTPHNLLSKRGNYWLHRKGAAVADRGLVPLAGSRDSHSYLLKPTGDGAQSLFSLAHGAGRKHNRTSMRKRVEMNRSMLSKMGRNPFGGRVVCEDRALLAEESGAAYKSVEGVVADLEKSGLARPVAKLRPLITYKKAKQK